MRDSPSFGLLLLTDGALPKSVAMTVEVDLDIDMRVGPSAAGQRRRRYRLGFQAVGGQSVGEDLVRPALALAGQTQGIYLPLFSDVTNTLALELVPVFSTFVLLETAETLEEYVSNLNISMGMSTRATIQVSWDVESGVDASLQVLQREDSVEVAGAEALRYSLSPGFRACLGLRLSVVGGGGVPLTTLEACPELRAFVQQLRGGVPELPAELLANTLERDRELCFELSFSTDARLDWLTSDNPYALVCAFGTCRQTNNEEYFSDGTVQWPDPLCLPVPAAALREGLVAHVEFREWDGISEHDRFTDPRELRLTPGRSRWTFTNLDLPRPEGVGTFARATIEITSRAPRRLTTGEECQGTAVSMSVGLSAQFGGFTYPSSFRRFRNEQVAFPVGRYTVRPDGPRTTCHTTTANTATPTMGPAALRAVVAAVIAAAASAGRRP